MSGVDRYGPLWKLLDIPDEAIIFEMEKSLKRAGVYNLEDLAFLSTRDVDFPSMVKPVFVRKFKTICEYYALGHRLDKNSTMRDVLYTLNPRASYRSQELNGSAVQVPPPPPPPPKPVETEPEIRPESPPPPPQSSEPPKAHLNVVIIGDCSPYKPGWHHLEEFSKIQAVKIHSILHAGPKPADESLMHRALQKNIRLLSKVDDFNVPQPNLYVLGSSRIHDLFKLMDLYIPPSCVLLDLPGTITTASLQALQACGNDHGCPIFINISQVLAPYVEYTLEAATSPLMTATEPRVSWYKKEDHTMVNMAQAFAKGRLMHTTALPELIIAVMYFGVKVESICRFQVNLGMTDKASVEGITDFTQAAFSMTTQSGIQLSILATRCAPVNACLGVVQDDQGRVVAQFDHLHSHTELKLKRRLVRSLMEAGGSSEILPSIRMVIEALRLAEHAEKHLLKAMDALNEKPERRGIMKMFSKRSS